MKITSKHPEMPSKKKNQIKMLPSETDEVSNLISQGGRNFLSTLKKKSIRFNNSWFRVLTVDKRRLIDAVIQTVDKIRSYQLLKILTPLAGRLLQAIGGVRGLIGNLSYGMQNFGRPLAQRISVVVSKWGNNLAAKWANDEGFIRFLTVNDMNDLPIFKVSNKL